MSLLLHDFDRLTSVTDEIDELIALVGVSKAEPLDPLKPGDLGKITRRIGGKLKRAVAGGEAAAMRAAIRELDVDWNSLDKAGMTRVIGAARRVAKKVIIDKTLPVVNQVFTASVKPIYGKSKKSSIHKHNLQINFSLNKQDEDIAAFVAKSQSNFIKNQYGQRVDALGARVRKIVAAGAGRGAGSVEIVKDLQTQLPSLNQLGRKQFYWEVVATSFVNRARNYANIMSYGEAGISRYIWESVLDEVTTETCRYLHGKSFSTGDELNRAKQLESSDSPEEIKQAQPWVSLGVNDDGEKSMFFRDASGEKRHIATVVQPAVGKADAIGTYNQKMSDKELGASGISMPPIHGLCRSTTVPDDSAPAPRTKPTPPAPRPVQGAKPRKVPIPAKHFEKFSSDLSAKDEAIMLRTVDDIGMSKFLTKNKIGRMVFTGTVGRTTAGNLAMGRNQGGVYYDRLEGVGVNTRKSTMKILSKGNLHDKWKFKPFEPTGWSVSQTAKTQLGAMQATLVHEMGHHVVTTGRKVLPLTRGRGYRLDSKGSSPEFIKTDSVIRTAFKKKQVGSLNGVSRYSNTDHDEYFAESFSAHAKDPAVLLKRDPVAFKMVENVRAIHGLDEVKRFIDGT